MAQDKRVFTGGMDKDSEPRLIKQGDYRDAKNIRNIASSDGTSGSVENIEGTQETNYNFIDESETVVEILDEHVIEPVVTTEEQIFYHKDILFRGKDSGNLQLMLLNQDSSGNLSPMFTSLNTLGVFTFGQGYGSGSTAAGFLYQNFNPIDGIFSQDIPLIGFSTSSDQDISITGRSEIYISNGSNNDYQPNTLTELGSIDTDTHLGDFTYLVLRIISNTPDVDFLIDCLRPSAAGLGGTPSISLEANLTQGELWSDTVYIETSEGVVYGQPYGFLDISFLPDDAAFLGMVDGFETITTEVTIGADENIAEDDNGNPIGDINVFGGNATITEVLMTITGINPETPQDPLNEFKLFSVVTNENGTVQAIPFAQSVFDQFESDFNSGDPFEFDGDRTEIAASIVDKISIPFSTQIIVPGSSSATTHTISTANQNVATGFNANTELGVFRRSNLSATASASSFKVLESYNSFSSFDYGGSSRNFIDSNTNTSINNNTITIISSARADFDKELFFPVPSGGLVKGETYRIEANISTFSSSGNSIVFQTKDGKNTSPVITSTDSSFSFQFEAQENNESFKLAIKSNFAEQDTIVLSGVSIKQYQEPESELVVAFRASYTFDLVFGTDLETVIDQYQQGTSVRDLEWFSGVNVNLHQTTQYGQTYDNIIVADENQDQIINELQNTIDGLNSQLSDLTAEYNSTINSLNEALALSSADAVSSYLTINSNLSDLNTVIETNDETLAGLIANINSDLNSISDLEGQVSGLEGNIQTYINEITILNDQSESLIETYTNLLLSINNVVVGLNLLAPNNNFLVTDQNSLLDGSKGWILYENSTTIGQDAIPIDAEEVIDINAARLVLERKPNASSTNITAVAAYDATDGLNIGVTSGEYYRLRFKVAGSAKSSDTTSEVGSVLSFYGGNHILSDGTSVYPEWRSVAGEVRSGDEIDIFYFSNTDHFAIRLGNENNSSNDRLVVLDDFILEQISSDTMSYIGDLNDQINAAEAELESIQNSISELNTVTFGETASASVNNLIEAYNSFGTSEMVTLVGGLITSLNEASFSDVSLESNINDQIQALESAIAAIVDLDETIGGDPGFQNLTELVDAIKALQTDSNDLLSLHQDLIAIASNIDGFIPGEGSDDTYGEVTNLIQLEDPGETSSYALYYSTLQQIVGLYETILSDANALSLANSDPQSELAQQLEDAQANLEAAQVDFASQLAAATADATAAYEAQVAAETALAEAEANMGSQTPEQEQEYLDQIAGLEATIATNDATIAENNATIEDLTEQLDSVVDTTNLENQIANLQGANGTLTANNVNLSSQITSINASLNNLSATLSQATINLVAAQDALVEADNDLATADQLVSALVEVVNQQEQDLEEALNNQEDGVSQADVDAAVSSISFALNLSLETLSNIAALGSFDNILLNSTFDDDSNVFLYDGIITSTLEINGGKIVFANSNYTSYNGANGSLSAEIDVADNSFTKGEYIISYHISGQGTPSISLRDGNSSLNVANNGIGPNISSTDGIRIHRLNKTSDDINDNVKLKFSGASTFHGSIDNVYLIKVPNNLAITDEQIGVLTGDLQSIQSQLISTFVDISNISSPEDITIAYSNGYSEGYSIGLVDGEASVTPDDGITQADVDAAYDAGVASVTPEDGFGPGDIGASYDIGYISGYNDGQAAGGFTQVDIDAAVAAAIDAANEEYNDNYNYIYQNLQLIGVDNTNLTQDVFSLLGLLTNLTSDIQNFSTGYLSNALSDLQLISTTSEASIAEYNNTYNTSVTNLNEIISSIQTQLSNVEQGELLDDANIYEEHSFVIFGDIAPGFDIQGDGSARITLSWINENLGITDYSYSASDRYLLIHNGGVHYNASIGSTVASSIYGSCHNFDGSEPHTYSEGVGVGHQHLKVVNPGQENETVLKLTLKNFNANDSMSSTQSPLIGEGYTFLDESGEVIDRGLHFTISVISGDPNWNFRINNQGTAGLPLDGGQGAAFNSGFNGSKQINDLLISSPSSGAVTITTSDTNLLTGNANPDGLAAGWTSSNSLASQNPAWIVVGNQWTNRGNSVVFSEDILSKSVDLEPGTLYEITFECWGRFGTNEDGLFINNYEGRRLTVNLGNNNAGVGSENTVIFPSDQLGVSGSYDQNTGYYEYDSDGNKKFRVWGPSAPGENTAIIDDFAHGALRMHKIYIRTGDFYTADTITFTSPDNDPNPNQADNNKQKGQGFTGWIDNISIKFVESFDVDTTTQATQDSVLKILYERTVSAQGRSNYLDPLYSKSRIMNGSAKRILKNKLTGAVREVPIVAGGYKCIGAYEDKPKNKIYYFVHNQHLNNKKYDCILEYDLIADSVATIYQDGRTSSDNSNNRILNFRDEYPITGISKVDNILYFTDNWQRPKKINVELAKQNEKNINNPKFVFKDAYYRSATSTVYIGIGSNNHDLLAEDHIYAQLGATSGLEATGINGYSKIIGVVRKPKVGITYSVSLGSPTVTASISSHGLEDFEGDWIGIEDANNNYFPFYYQISTVVGNTITLASPYDQATNSIAHPVSFQGQNAVGIITDSPWPGAFTPVDGVILYSDPYSDNRERILDAYSPLISFGTYEDKMKYFDVVKHQPTHQPFTELRLDPSFATNNILDNVFQFKYRYIHIDNEQTSYSPISDIAIDPVFGLNSAVDASDYNSISNVIDVAYEDGIGDVKDVEIVARKGNTGEFFLIDTATNNFINYLKKAKNKYLPEYQYPILGEEEGLVTSSVSFYNNGTYPFIDKRDSDKLFDAVPKLAKAQTILSNNRLAYGNVLEGYDNTKLIASSRFAFDEDSDASTVQNGTVQILTSTESGQGGFSSLQTDSPDSPSFELFNLDLGGGHGPFGASAGRTKHRQAWDLGSLNLSSGGTQMIYISYIWKYDKKPDTGSRQKRNGTFSLSGVNVTGITDVNELGQFLADAINQGLGVTTTEFGHGSEVGPCGNETVATFNSNYDNTGAKLLIVTFKYNKNNEFSFTLNGAGWGQDNPFDSANESVFISGDGGTSSYKSGAFHNFGISYFDETNRCSFVNAAVDYSGVQGAEAAGGVVLNGTRPYNKFFTESAGPPLNQGAAAEINIYSRPPVWATHYQVCYTGNTTIDNDPDSDFPGFIQMMFVGVKVAEDSNDKQIYLNMGALKGQDWSYNQANNSKLNYNYVAGDRIRFISFDRNGSRHKFSQYIDLEIAGMDLYLDVEEPPISVNETTEGFYLRINDPGESSVIYEGAGAGNTISIAHAGFNLATSGYNKLIAEIYRPKKDLDSDLMVYYEVGPKFPVMNAGSPNRNHGGFSVQGHDFTFNRAIGDYISSIPSTIKMTSGDVYLKPRSMANVTDGSEKEVFFPEDYYLNDFHRTNHYSRGRINIINNNSAQRRLGASVYYSETYSSTGSSNGLSSFNLANVPYFDYNKDFGSIQSLQTRDNDLIIFHENKVGRVLVEKDILNTASGEGLVSLSTNIIGNYVNLYKGDYGCGYHPESIVKFANIFYFVDIKRGAVLRLSADGLTVISDNGMRDYFRDLGEMYVIHNADTSESPSGEVFNIVAGYDPKYDEYIVSFPNVYAKLGEGLWEGSRTFWDSSFDKYQNRRREQVYEAKTLAFNERINRWTSFYDIYPEFYSKVGRQFISFKDGRLYRHNMTDRFYQNMYGITEEYYLTRINRHYNSFYGSQFDSHIQFPFNADPSSVKSFNALSLESDVKLLASMYTNIGQVIEGPDLEDGYERGISTNIAFKKVSGLVSDTNSPIFSEYGSNVIIGQGVKFFEEVRVGDLVRIFGKNASGEYAFINRIVTSVISNNIISLSGGVTLDVLNNHMEVIDYKTKEGVHYTNIPFVSSELTNSVSGYGGAYGAGQGDGSEFTGIGLVLTMISTSSIFKNIRGTFSSFINNSIGSDQMVVGAEYVYISGDGFDITNFNNQYDSTTFLKGSVFVCQQVPSQSLLPSRVLSTNVKLYARRSAKNGSQVVFLGYPYSSGRQEIGFVADFDYIQPSHNELESFLFIVKDGHVEGEKMKGQYMMTTLTTEHPGTAVLSKYKFNLYAANVDVDKSELSNK
tara:strand:- start:828 stop:12974 length:12147 start_codon:yes stop_codon:yes gene_type:complete